MRTANTLIRLGGCPGWSESSLGAHSFFWFCHVAAHMSSCLAQSFIQLHLRHKIDQNACTFLILLSAHSQLLICSLRRTPTVVQFTQVDDNTIYNINLMIQFRSMQNNINIYKMGIQDNTSYICDFWAFWAGWVHTLRNLLWMSGWIFHYQMFPVSSKQLFPFLHQILFQKQ